MTETENSADNAEQPTNEEVWVEVSRDKQGVHITTYHDSPDTPEPKVVDEAGWTWGEFTGIEATELPISIDVGCRLEAVEGPVASCPQSIVDVLSSNGLLLADAVDAGESGSLEHVELFEGAGAVEELLARMDE
jgi:hypothetical protein